MSPGEGRDRARPGLLRRCRFGLEYAAVRGFELALLAVPGGVALWLARRLGDLMFLSLRGRAAVGRGNLEHALPELSADERARVLRASFQNFAIVPVELIRLRRELRRRSAEEIVRVEGAEHLDAARAHGGGAIFLTGHIGNWEVVGALSAVMGFPFTSVARGSNNPSLDRMLQALRCAHGQEVVDKAGAGRAMVRALREGRSVGMLLDQHAGTHGIRVPFFGRLASTYASGAHLARRLQVPVLPLFCERGPGFLEVVVRFFPPIWPNPDLPAEEDQYRMTSEYTLSLERAVREQPEQYLWFHRRWRDSGRQPRSEWLERYAGQGDAEGIVARASEEP